MFAGGLPIYPQQSPFNQGSPQSTLLGNLRKIPVQAQSPFIQKLIDQLSTQALYNTTNTEQARAQFLTGKPQEAPQDKKPGILGRIFDVISRPLYGVAEGVNAAIKSHGNPLKAVEGIGYGIEGKKKTSFSDVLGTTGVKNKWAKSIAGLALDIGLDPTTYLSFGANVGMKTGEAAKIAATEAPTLFKDVGSAAKFVNRFGQTGVQDLLGRAIQTTSKRGKQFSTREALSQALQKEGLKGQDLKNALQDTERNFYTRYGDKVSQGLLDAHRGTFGPRFMGMNIPGMQSEHLYNVGQHVKKFVDDNQALSSLNKFFHRKAELGISTEANKLRRVNEARGFANWQERFAKPWTEAGKGINDAGANAITHAIETRTVDKLPEELKPLAAKTIEQNRALALEELPLGILKPEDVLTPEALDKLKNGQIKGLGALSPEDIRDDYMYHAFTNVKKAQELGYKDNPVTRKLVGPEEASYSHARSYKETLQDITKNHPELKPVTRFDDIMKLRTAKYSDVIARRSFVDDMIKQGGVVAQNAAHRASLKEAGFKEVKSKFAPKGIFMEPEMTRAINMTQQITKAPGQFLRHFDQVQNQMKFLSTAMNPGFHIKHSMGSVFNNFLDGVVNPNKYKEGIKLATGGEDALKEMAYRVGDMKLSGDDVKRLIQNHGGVNRFNAEFGMDTGIRGQGIAGKLSQVERPMRVIQNKREEIFRTTHFLDALQKEGKGAKSLADVDAAASKAMDRVHKFNFDYMDLSEKERTVAKRLIPFYTFMRKNVPLQLEMLATRPGREAVVPKALHAIEGMFGIDTRQGLPPGMVMPAWIKDMAGVSAGGNNFFAPELPISRLGEMTSGGVSGMLRGLMSQMTPGIKAPVEIATQKNLFTGAPLHLGSPSKVLSYLLQQIPQSDYLATRKPVPGETPPSVLEQLVHKLQTGVGFREVSPIAQRSELKRQSDVIAAIIKQMEQQYAAKGIPVPWKSMAQGG